MPIDFSSALFDMNPVADGLGGNGPLRSETSATALAEQSPSTSTEAIMVTAV